MFVADIFIEVIMTRDARIRWIVSIVIEMDRLKCEIDTQAKMN
jgi:hypothetical protein